MAKTLAATHRKGIADARALDDKHGRYGEGINCACRFICAHISVAEGAALDDGSYFGAGDETIRLWSMKDGSAFYDSWYDAGGVLRKNADKLAAARIVKAETERTHSEDTLYRAMDALLNPKAESAADDANAILDAAEAEYAERAGGEIEDATGYGDCEFPPDSTRYRAHKGRMVCEEPDCAYSTDAGDEAAAQHLRRKHGRTFKNQGVSADEGLEVFVALGMIRMDCAQRSTP